MRFPEEEQLHDFEAWFDDLGISEQQAISEMLDVIELLPEFSKEWTISKLWSAVRDYLGE